MWRWESCRSQIAVIFDGLCLARREARTVVGSLPFRAFVCLARPPPRDWRCAGVRWPVGGKLGFVEVDGPDAADDVKCGGDAAVLVCGCEAAFHNGRSRYFGSNPARMVPTPSKPPTSDDVPTTWLAVGGVVVKIMDQIDC